MTDREKLIKLFIEAKKADTEDAPFSEFLADFLIANGVTFAPEPPDTTCTHLSVSEADSSPQGEPLGG